jgi:hypothetical protein
MPQKDQKSLKTKINEILLKNKKKNWWAYSSKYTYGLEPCLI